MNQLGEQSFDQMKVKIPQERDRAVNDYIRCISRPLVEQVPQLGDFNSWEIVVFKDESPNAFALPGSKIGVHTGILKVAKTDAQLAAVLGHEIGHVQAKHGNERVSTQFGMQLGLVGLSEILGNKRDMKTQGILLAAMGVATLGVQLPFSRNHESEADEIGLGIMSRAGFDPRESVALWKNMMSTGKGQPPEFLSTHPSNESRIRGLEAKMPEAMKAYQAAQSAGKKPHCQL